MSLLIDDPEAERLAHEVSRRTGQTVAGAVTHALRQALVGAPAAEADELVRPKARSWSETWAAVEELQRRSAARPILDARTPEEMLYDEDGLPR